MRILLSTYGSRGDVEPLAALAVQLQAQGARAVMSAPGDAEFVTLLDRAGVELAPAFMPVRDWIEMATRTPLDLPTRAAEMIAAQYDAIAAAGDGCDAVVATGLMPSVAAAQCVAEKRGIPYFHVTFCPLFLPSQHHRPYPYPGHPLPPEVTDPRALWDLNARTMNALFGGAANGQREAIGLQPVDNIRDHVFTGRPLLASDPVLWPWLKTDLCDAVQTGAWILPDTRPLPPDLEAFLNAGSPPVYVGFGSMSMQSAKDAAHVAIGAIRAQGRRIVLARGWAEMERFDGGGDCFLTGDVNQQALFPRMQAVIHHGGAGTTTTAARAGAPQLIVPQIVDQPFWAERIAALGAGAAHDGPAPGFESLSAALAVALDPRTKARAAAIARQIPTDGAARAARLVLDAVAR